jgi:uncharacterized protein
MQTSPKPSRYNYFVDFDSRHAIGYNFLYRSILRLPNTVLDRVTQYLARLSSGDGHPVHEQEQLPIQWLNALKESNFIIDANFDEISLLKFRYRQSLFSGSSLSLIILPTLWCNLDCPYCFEFKKREYMSREVEDALLGWVESHFANKRAVHVAWFGGEPLIAKPAIYRLSERLQKFCKDIHAQYTSSLTTNGFYLDREFQSAIPSLALRNIQVTLDGDKEQHDILRRQRNGKGSFDTIIGNIADFCENVHDCHLSIRVNCGDSNYDSIPGLMRRFPPAVKANASIFFRWIWANKASGYRDFAECRRGKRPFEGLADLYLEMNKQGWRTHNPHNSLQMGYCEVDFLDHYSVDPHGNLYLCTHTFDASEAIGSVCSQNDFIRPGALPKYLKWYEVDPFGDPECLDCNLLPMCLGGCRMSRVKGKRECIEEKYDRDLFVKNLVREQLYGKDILDGRRRNGSKGDAKS